MKYTISTFKIAQTDSGSPHLAGRMLANTTHGNESTLSAGERARGAKDGRSIIKCN